jgi:hypothetical protein
LTEAELAKLGLHPLTVYQKLDIEAVRIKPKELDFRAKFSE